MIQIITAIIVAIWFFRAARTVGRSGTGWAFIGVLVLIAPSIPWAIFARLVILPALTNSDIGDGGAILGGLMIGLVGVSVGLAIVLLTHRRWLRPVSQTDSATGSSLETGDHDSV